MVPSPYGPGPYNIRHVEKCFSMNGYRINDWPSKDMAISSLHVRNSSQQSKLNPLFVEICSGGNFGRTMNSIS